MTSLFNKFKKNQTSTLVYSTWSIKLWKRETIMNFMKVSLLDKIAGILWSRLSKRTLAPWFLMDMLTNRLLHSEITSTSHNIIASNQLLLRYLSPQHSVLLYRSIISNKLIKILHIKMGNNSNSSTFWLISDRKWARTTSLQIKYKTR